MTVAGTVPLVDTYSFASFASGDSKEAEQYVSMAEEDVSLFLGEANSKCI